MNHSFGQRIAAAVVVLVAVAAGSACSGGDAETIVLVPSSFTDVVDAIDLANEPDPTWVLAGSSRLVSQLADGADASLLITADQTTMNQAVADGLVTTELGVVARNRLVLAVAPGNAAGIESIDDLADDSRLVGVCAIAVPCGRLAAAALDELDIDLAADTEEASVRALAVKISRGELDAGLIYATDALSLDLSTVDSDRLADFVTEYPAAAIGTGDEGGK